MIQVMVTTRDGATRAVEGRDGEPLMRAIKNAGLDELQALCGGACACATCHVYVDVAAFGLLPPMQDDENDLLDGNDARTEQSRLSCQIPLAPGLDGLRVTIAPES